MRGDQQQESQGRYLWLWLLALALVVIGAASLLAGGGRSTPAEPERRAPAARASEPGPAPRVARAPSEKPAVEQHTARAEPRAEPSPPAPPAAAEATDSADGPDEFGHPHPITPQHERIFRENNLVGSLNDAMDRGDVERLRSLNAQYRQDYPEDGHVLQEGYDLIADCLEERTPEVQEAARRFWQDHRSSQLRRYVRRHCLGDTAP